MLQARKIPVLMYGWELPPQNTGGLGVACYGLAKGLAQLGLPLSFALPRQLSTQASFMRLLTPDLKGVSVTAINSLLRAYMTSHEYTSTHYDLASMYGASLYEEALRFGEMAKAWATSQPHSVIHAHDWMSYPAAMKSRDMSGKPWIAHIHATEYDRSGENINPRIAEIEYQGLHDANRIIAVSSYTKEVVKKRYSISDNKIDVIHNGHDPFEFSPADFRHLFPHDKVVLFVGRLTYQKGVEYFLQSAKRVLEWQPHTIFLVVGTGDLEEKLIMDASYMGIGGRVFFPGFLNGDALRSLYQMADVFVMPSVSEPYGIVALEAVASGVPAIISKQSGVVETLTNVSLVDFWDTQKMSRQILTALNFPTFFRERARLAQSEARQLTWDLAAQKTLSVYRNVLE